ncbi:MAG TPA: hypothetical protein VGE04_04125 [Chloroflexia bacterium]|jgi:hypothetical protein
MLVVSALALAHAVLGSQGAGLGAGWLVLLLVPGALDAHLERGSAGAGEQDAEGTAGLRAGIVTAHFAALLLSAWVVVAVLTTDWERYAAQVGPEAAYAVRDAALPATVLLVVLAVAVAYVGCGVAGLLGGLAYSVVRNLVK